MRFQAENRFHGSPAAVAAILADPDFYVRLRLPDLSQPEILGHQVDGWRAVVRLRYIFVGNLDGVARRLLGKRQLAWIQEIDVDQTSGTGHLVFNAETDPKRLHGSADFTLQALRLDAGGEGCIRRLRGELVVSVPVIRARAERQIVAGLLRRLDIEAEALDQALSDRPK
jgi:hypothetical protein